MAQIGKQATLAIIWFQFVVAQLLAMVMLSSSICDEIRTGTLNVLMTTPVNSFQIVTGKFFSKLLQIFLLLAVSLPLLAIIRVFGGVQWISIVCGLCTTVTSVIFAGSLSLLLSVFNRYSFRVIIIEIVIYVILFAVIPFFLLMFGSLDSSDAFRDIIYLVNPFAILSYVMEGIYQGSAAVFLCVVNCLLFSFLSGIFLFISMWKVRSANFDNISARKKKNESKRIIKDENGNEIAHYYESPGNIRRVVGNPIAWKEKNSGVFGKSKLNKIGTILIYLLMIFGIVSILFTGNFFFILMSYGIMVMYLVIMLKLAISTAGNISNEKEARTMSVLLMTPLTDKEIILGKVKAAIKRNIPLLILFIILNFSVSYHYVSRGMMSLKQIIIQTPLTIVYLAGMVIFIVGCGSYIGVRMRNSMAAIATTIGTFLVTYILLSFLNPLRLILLFAVRVVSNMALIQLISFASSLISAIILAGIGLLFMRKSIRNLRRYAF